jgi:hypothetical protein
LIDVRQFVVHKIRYRIFDVVVFGTVPNFLAISHPGFSSHNTAATSTASYTSIISLLLVSNKVYSLHCCIFDLIVKKSEKEKGKVNEIKWNQQI